MAITLNEARELKEVLSETYRDRHNDYRLLRAYWHGKYWQVADQQNTAIASFFKDMRKGSNTEPEMRVVHNLLQEVCVKYQTYLSNLPQISVYIDPPASQNRRTQADRKERFLYGVWDAGNMLKVASDAAWYLPLFGHAFLGVFPDVDQKLPRPILRSPEYAYPVMSFDGQTEALIFAWKIPEATARRNFPKYTGRREKNQTRGVRNWFASKGEQAGDGVEVLEYYDRNCWYRWVGDDQVAGLEHGFGWSLFEDMKFINVPGEPWGHGAVEQAVGMVEAGNVLYSLLMHAVIANVFPVLWLDNPQGAPEEMDLGPGGVVATRDGGKVGWLHPPVEALNTQTGFLNVIDQNVKQATGMPDINFGQARQSIITGKAVNELSGLGTGSTVEMVQSLGLGAALVSWNSKAIEMQRELWPDDKVPLFGQRPDGVAALKPQRFSFSVAGKELVGSTRNEVTFLPHLNMHEKVVMGLQMAGAELVSKRWQRDQVGIPDSEAMDEEIVGEQVSAAVVEAIVQSLVQAGASPEAATGAEDEAVAYLAGGTHVHPAAPAPGQAAAPGLPVGGPGPLLPGGPSAGGPPPPGGGGGPAFGPLGPGAPGEAVSPPLPLPAGSPPPAAGLPGAAPGGPSAAPLPPAQGAASGGDNGVKLGEVAQAIEQLQGIVGRVWLIGEIVDKGSTSGDIEVALSDEADEQTIRDGLPQYAGRLRFQVVPQGEPDEASFEVTPGRSSGPPPEGGAAAGGPPPAEPLPQAA